MTDKRRLNKLKRRELAPEDIDNQMAMVVGLVEAATFGDAKAAKVVLEMLDDDPAQKNAGETLSALYDALETEEEPNAD